VPSQLAVVAQASSKCALRADGVDYFEKWEAVEIGVADADSTNPVLAHESGGVDVVEQIAREMRRLRNDRLGDVRMSRRGNESGEARRGQ
jgi:hypothetical protein